MRYAYLMRHAESRFVNGELTKKGEQQAKDAAKTLRKDIKTLGDVTLPVHIWYSPVYRAYQTARRIEKKLHIHNIALEDHRLLEGVHNLEQVINELTADVNIIISHAPQLETYAERRGETWYATHAAWKRFETGGTP